MFSREGRRYFSPVWWVLSDTPYYLERMFSSGIGLLWFEIHSGQQQPSEAGGKEDLAKRKYWFSSLCSPGTTYGNHSGCQERLHVTAEKVMEAQVYQCHQIRVIVVQVACETLPFQCYTSGSSVNRNPGEVGRNS